RLFDIVRRSALTTVTEHHRRAQKQSGWIRLVLPRYVRCGAVHRLEDRYIVPDVGRWSEAQSTGQTRRQITQDVAVHVGGDSDVELFGPHRQLVRGVVDQNVFRRY